MEPGESFEMFVARILIVLACFALPYFEGKRVANHT
jgi:hypothetical protein